MNHTHSLTIALIALLTACGSNGAPNGSEITPNGIEVEQVTPVPVATITVDQDANMVIAPGPVQPNAPIVATPLPAMSPVPAPSETPAPIASATPEPTPSATPCTQTRTDGTYDYTCGLWILSAPQGSGCPSGHATELELTQSAQGQWMDGSYVVTLYQGGGISWDQGNVTIGAQGNGLVYVTVAGAAGRGNTEIPCIFTVSPAN